MLTAAEFQKWNIWKIKHQKLPADRLYQSVRLKVEGLPLPILIMKP
jgi:hypothetical protein